LCALGIDIVFGLCYNTLKLIDTQPLEEPHNAAAHRSQGRKDQRNMSTTQPQPVIKITYNKEDRDYSVSLNGNLLGYTKTYAEGEEMVREYSTQLAQLVACNVTMKEAA
jgi:hypothetical protein